MNSPSFKRVTLIPMETTLFSSENSHTKKAAILEKGLTLVPVLHNPSNEWA